MQVPSKTEVLTVLRTLVAAPTDPTALDNARAVLARFE
jgi:hypothetical protein